MYEILTRGRLMTSSIDEVVVRKLPVAESKSVWKERCLEAPFVVSDEMEVEVPVLRNAPHDGSNLMKTENAGGRVWFIERDLIQGHGGIRQEWREKEENKETNIMSSFWVAITWQKQQNETSCWHPWTRDFKRTHHQRRTSFLPKKCRKSQSLSAIIYRRRTNFGHRNNWASPRGPAVKSKVLIIEGY